MSKILKHKGDTQRLLESMNHWMSRLSTRTRNHLVDKSRWVDQIPVRTLEDLISKPVREDGYFDGACFTKAAHNEILTMLSEYGLSLGMKTPSSLRREAAKLIQEADRIEALLNTANNKCQ